MVLDVVRCSGGYYLRPSVLAVRVGFCNGCFDGFHAGHRYFLSVASTYCDWLIVAVNTDASIRLLKGLDRPLYDLEWRLRRVRSSGFVSSVIPFNGDPVLLIQAILPDVLIRGEDQSDHGSEYATKLVRVNRLAGISTTDLCAARGFHAPH